MMLCKKVPKKDKVNALPREGETSCTMIANRAHCSVACVNVVKNELLRELLLSQKA